MTSSAARMSAGNQRVYQSGSVAEHYAGLSDLFPAERILLNRLEQSLPAMRMLDLGVGGGRTSVHFAHRVKSYLGLDYSASMIEGCRKRFPDPPANVAFTVGDARSLTACADASFDLILFSYNGLDYVGHEDRHLVFREMRRLLAPGGRLCFSTHNLMSLGLPAGPGDRGWRARFRRLAIRFLNGDLRALRQGSYAVIRDDGCHFRLRTFYVRPSEQASQLRSLGLGDVKISAPDGRELDAADPDGAADEWLYYLARLA
jgi:SAM-dependent methyltransferase